MLPIVRYDDSGNIELYNNVEHLNIPQSVPTCGHFSIHGTYGIRRLQGRQNTAQYIEGLESVLLENSFQEQKPIPFVHDHHFVHNARVVKTWFDTHEEFDLLPWPQNFGDVMPMERLWSDVYLDLKNKSVFSVDQLWDEINVSFQDVCSKNNFLNDYVCGIPNKLKEIVEADGKLIK